MVKRIVGIKAAMAAGMRKKSEPAEKEKAPVPAPAPTAAPTVASAAIGGQESLSLQGLPLPKDGEALILVVADGLEGLAVFGDSISLKEAKLIISQMRDEKFSFSIEEAGVDCSEVEPEPQAIKAAELVDGTLVPMDEIKTLVEEGKIDQLKEVQIDAVINSDGTISRA